MVNYGKNGAYFWLVAVPPIRAIAELIIANHAGMHLCVSAFDSGPLSLSDKEKRFGWSVQNNVAVSPPLGSGIEIPYDSSYDEWYVMPEPDFTQFEVEIFVNYMGFRLEAPEVLLKGDDPTWDRKRHNWLEPIQERFWAQIEQLTPETYVSMGDLDIVVSRNDDIVKLVTGAA